MSNYCKELSRLNCQVCKCKIDSNPREHGSLFSPSYAAIDYNTLKFCKECYPKVREVILKL